MDRAAFGFRDGVGIQRVVLPGFHIPRNVFSRDGMHHVAQASIATHHLSDDCTKASNPLPNSILQSKSPRGRPT